MTIDIERLSIHPKVRRNVLFRLLFFAWQHSNVLRTSLRDRQIFCVATQRKRERCLYILSSKPHIRTRRASTLAPSPTSRSRSRRPMIRSSRFESMSKSVVYTAQYDRKGLGLTYTLRRKSSSQGCLASLSLVRKISPKTLFADDFKVNSQRTATTDFLASL